MYELRFIQRLKLITAFNSMFLDRVEREWQPFFLTFLFRNISGKDKIRIDTMNAEVGRFYATLLPYIVRHHHRAKYRELLPLLIAAPDLNVPKAQKKSLRSLHTVNGGLHFHGMLALPPIDKCRLGNRLLAHLNEKEAAYIRADRPLFSIDARMASTAMLADYTMKHVKRGRIDYGDILILPKASSELR